jgi:hypothetical protein
MYLFLGKREKGKKVMVVLKIEKDLFEEEEDEDSNGVKNNFE